MAGTTSPRKGQAAKAKTPKAKTPKAKTPKAKSPAAKAKTPRGAKSPGKTAKTHYSKDELNRLKHDLLGGRALTSTELKHLIHAFGKKVPSGYKKEQLAQRAHELAAVGAALQSPRRATTKDGARSPRFAVDHNVHRGDYMIVFTKVQAHSAADAAAALAAEYHLPELRQIAIGFGLRNYSGLSKEELIKLLVSAIKNQGVQPAATTRRRAGKGGSPKKARKPRDPNAPRKPRKAPKPRTPRSFEELDRAFSKGRTASATKAEFDLFLKRKDPKSKIDVSRYTLAGLGQMVRNYY